MSRDILIVALFIVSDDSILPPPTPLQSLGDEEKHFPNRIHTV